MEFRSETTKDGVDNIPRELAKLKDIVDDKSIDDEEKAQQRKADMITQYRTEMKVDSLQRTIYLTIMNGDSINETGHKLHEMITLEDGHKIEVCKMLVECCSRERMYQRYYSLIAQTLCRMRTGYKKSFVDCFREQYVMAPQMETTKLRNVAKFFAHMLGGDGLPWHTLSYLWLTEDTTPSLLVFMRVLFQELAEHLGLLELKVRLAEPSLQDSLAGILPKDKPKNTQFSITFFTAIGLGDLTDSLHDYVNSMPDIIKNQSQPPATRKRLASHRECSECQDSAAHTFCIIEDYTHKDRNKYTKRPNIGKAVKQKYHSRMHSD